MSRIIISTNNVLYDIFGQIPETVGLQTQLTASQLSLLTGETKYLYFNETDSRFEADNNNAQIIVVQDNYVLPAETTFNEDDFLLHHHQESEHHLPSIKPKFGNRLRQGQHTQGSENEYLYEKVFKIIFDNNNNKAQRIIEFLFPTADTILGKKLDLLHSLLVPPVDFADAKEQWKKIKEAVDEARTRGVVVSFPADVLPLTDFETAVSNITGAFDKPYLEALTKLRDTLLV